jgi:outer membrane protein OmpA-like peptidoglycan-associated protein
MQPARLLKKLGPLPIAMLAGAVLLTGCGSPIVFEGQSALGVPGTPPPPPPPPPPPEPEAPPPPPEPPPRVEVRDNMIEIREKIQFEYNSSRIKEESHSLLNEIADVIKKNPHIKKIAIEGHASAEGGAAYNLRLSDQRAKAVMQYLVDQAKIPAASLTAKGYGVTKPIADNDTEEGREKNRRVEFNIVEQDVTRRRIEIDPKTGQEKVISEEAIAPPAPAPAPAPEGEAPAPAPMKKPKQ